MPKSTNANRYAGGAGTVNFTAAKRTAENEVWKQLGYDAREENLSQKRNRLVELAERNGYNEIGSRQLSLLLQTAEQERNAASKAVSDAEDFYLSELRRSDATRTDIRGAKQIYKSAFINWRRAFDKADAISFELQEAINANSKAGRLVR